MNAWRGEDLSESERKAIASLPHEREPRAEIEETLVAELRKRGALRRGRSRAWWRAGAGAAAAAAFFVGGAIYGRSGVSATPPQAHWVLLLREGREDRSVSAEESRRRVQEYANWARSNIANGLIGGEKLGGGVLLHAGSESSIVHTPESLAGYFLLQPVDVAKARAIALTCPHLRYGGEIELRAIETDPGSHEQGRILVLGYGDDADPNQER
jgi:hypothetical protein